MVSWGRASVQPAERTAGKVDLAKFQWKGRDPRGPRGGAVARQELLATSKPEPLPSRSWFENEKPAKQDDPVFVRRRTESHVPRRTERRERQNDDQCSQRSPTHWMFRRRQAMYVLGPTTIFRERCTAQPCYKVILATAARPIPHAPSGDAQPVLNSS